METTVINIGNSKGVMLNKALIDKYNITDRVELILEENCIVLKPIHQIRKNWDIAFKEMHANGDDKLLIDDVIENENFEEWK